MTPRSCRNALSFVSAYLGMILTLSAATAHASFLQSERLLEHTTAVPGGPSAVRIALVIGNSNYASAPLKNPVNDATDMAAALREAGFQVTLGTDWTKRQMETAIREFGTRLRSGGIGLFYFAGHGMQVRGRNYLVPVGFELGTESDVEYEAVDASRVLGQMEDAGNGLNVVILDACRNNPFGRGFRSAEQGLAQVTAPTGSFIGYATAPGSVAADGAGRNGTYTAALLEALRVPGLKVEDVFKRVRQTVAGQTGRKQVPWDSSSLVGDFYFTEAPSGREAAERPAAPPGSSPASSLDIVTRTINALGGGAFLRQRSLRLKGTLSLTPSSTDPTVVTGAFTGYEVYPNQCRVDVAFGAASIGTVVYARNGATGWNQNSAGVVDTSATGSVTHILPGLDLLRQPDIRSYSIRQLPDTSIDGRTVNVFEVRDPDGGTGTYYVDSTTFLPVKVVTTGAQETTEIYLRDYRDVAGTKIPALVVSQSKNGLKSETVFKDIEVNVEISPSLFERPR